MKIEIGKYYRTRSGEKVDILKTDNGGGYSIIGVVDNSPQKFTKDGFYFLDKFESLFDIVSEWIEPLEFDWSCLPDWANTYIAMDEDGEWYCFDDKPLNREDIWRANWQYRIPSSHAPKNYSGNWDDSLFKNPNK